MFKGARANPMSADPGGFAAEHLASIIDIRRARSDAFGADLFSDPAWDILLLLLAARLGGKTATFADLADVGPRSTVARWLLALEKKDLITCASDHLAQANCRFELTDDGAAKMMTILRRSLHFCTIE
jgi:hypothetical protein